ncbi:hypothetical protein A2V71_01545 [Candidatus Berkelbacteria bacterium RBG_13_40_8]|uniref:Predicted membrane protein YciQ-like C-terminal domain-containing protein n=1 Tax=Candidatus Berkelbacteria bacterium RBG_13_40_8 TaxID=1797467 RepID=A0A1F5DP29_9BACT|nr:MAG: hypothetical protein A2V71_01545 [Candidatus Berkelbacteria bacterium RBG_13_40_8]
MHTIELIKAILRSMDFYWKKFLIFSLIIFLGVGGFFLWRFLNGAQADIEFAQTPQFTSTYQYKLKIEVKDNGQVIINGKDSSGDLKIFPEYYEVRILALDNPGTFINNFEADMTLPHPVEKSAIEQQVYAVHGVSSYRTEMTNSRTLVYTAENISPQASLTIVAHLPKDILTPPLGKRIIYSIGNVPAQIFLGIAIFLPLLTLIILLFMIYKRRKDQMLFFGVEPSSRPPQDVPPAVAGVLIDGQVGAREIAATLISLAVRGYIFITRKGGYFAFGKRKSLDLEKSSELEPYEKLLLSKIFMPQDYRSTREDVEQRVGRHIFSRKIALVYLEIYNEATRLGYFIQNPAAVHLRWKYTGITLFFLGILGFVYTVFFAPDPKFTLIFWVGEIAAASVIIKFSSLMPTRSSQGSQSLSSWMAFRKYLKMNEKIEPGAVLEDKFNELLPFAIVFGVEAEWAKRFMKGSFVKPDWYESMEPVTTLEEFVGGLFPLISFVGSILAESHEPTVE